jgi:hypothetical protein
MEIVDNLIMVVIPGALHAGLGDVLFWGSLSFALAVAGAFAFPLNRWLIARGRGHAAVHKTGVHGGPPAREVGAIAVAAALFGTAVLVAEAIDGDHGSGTGHMAMGASAQPEQVRGLSASADGMTLEVAQRSLPAVSGGDLAFAIVDVNGERVRDYEVEHTKRMHLILARRDLTGFWHLHPRLDKSGMWRIDVRGPDSGAYRVFADFRRHGKNVTLAI